MQTLGRKLDTKLAEWKPTTSSQVRTLVEEIIRRADEDVLDLARSRRAEQEVLNAIDEA
ncbi:MAG: hypothetical protein AMXMBFR81_07780 [Chthonomonas sp.]